MTNEFILVTDSVHGSILKLNLATLEVGAIPIQQQVISPIAIDYDPVESRIYWTDVALFQICSAFINGTGYKVIKTLKNGIKHVSFKLEKYYQVLQ